MKMKTITTVAVAGMMVFSLTACGSGAGTEKQGMLREIKRQKAVLRLKQLI